MKKLAFAFLAISLAALARKKDDSPDYWAVEDSANREKLPPYKTIPAAKPKELTPTNGFPRGVAALPEK